jgi:SNF2 family DNA or RNA helicase
MGVIPLKQREAFLNRERFDYRKYKNMTEDQLEQMILKLPVKPPIFYKLTLPQKVSFLIGVETKSFCLFLDTGVGKTVLTIALVRYFRRLGLIKRALILVPARTNKVEWKDELIKHSPNSSCLVLPSSIQEKWDVLQNDNSLFVVESYAGLFNMCCKKVMDKKGKNHLTLDAKKIKWLQKSFQAFVCDESENVGSHQGLPFRICRQLAKTCEVKFTMTGTPFNRDPSLLWSQMFLVDGGYTLGETLGLFRSVFCSETENYFSGRPEYKFLKKKQPLLNDFIANRSIEYEADQASLPACVPIKKYVSLDSDAMTYYERFKNKLIASQGNYTESKNAFLRLRQISSGFVGYQDDETGEKAKFEFPENPKLEMLLSILKSTRPEYKVIVFFEFNYSGEKILAELKRNKIGATIIYGKTKDVEASKKKYMSDPKTRVLLLQWRMAAGLNLQITKYGIYFESPVSASKRKQCTRRVERQHSLHKTVFIYDLIMKGGVDEQILEFHAEGDSLFEAIVRGAKKLK